ncbi:MAG TPA: DUF998 domain-containing protein [Actinomycetales bacterium]|nr:DUF998 domain-containing protein [Actinomycetales bacterium]
MTGGGATRRGSVAGAVLGGVAGVLNLGFVAEWALSGPARVGATAVSDLSIPSRPWSWAFRSADAVSALCLLALCLLVRARRRRPAERGRFRFAWPAAWTLAAAFATSTLLAAVVTETCAPAYDPGCPERLSDASVVDVVHDVVSSAGTACGILAALLLAVAVRRARRLSASHAVAAALASVTGLVFVALQARPQDDLSGWAQRGQILALSAWFVVAGLTADHIARAGVEEGPGRRHEKMRA